jgi:predicted metal-binding membrane protein
MQAANAGLDTLLRRDRVVVAGALAILTLLAWAYVFWLASHMAMPVSAFPAAGTPSSAAVSGDMAGMDMGPSASPAGDMAGMDMSGMAGAVAPAFRAWTPAEFAFMFAMWSVMMVGMMTPSVAPMILLYAGVGRKAAESGTPFASTGWFFAGYLAVWIAFSALATFAQWALTALALLTPMMAATSTIFGGIVLVAVGLYQWTPLKNTCLRACQAPLGFLMAHGGFRNEPLGAFRLGVAHGAYCLGCCFALMALLFVGGIMNVLWIAGLTILVLFEKVVPAGRLFPRIFGALIGAVGVWLLVRAS